MNKHIRQRLVIELRMLLEQDGIIVKFSLVAMLTDAFHCFDFFFTNELSLLLISFILPLCCYR